MSIYIKSSPGYFQTIHILFEHLCKDNVFTFAGRTWERAIRIHCTGECFDAIKHALRRLVTMTFGTWCSSAKRENSNNFSFSHFYYVQECHSCRSLIPHENHSKINARTQVRITVRGVRDDDSLILLLLIRT